MFSFRGRRFDPQTGIFADEERIRAAAEAALSIAEILSNLGLRSSGTRYAQLRAALVRHGIQQPAKDRLGMKKSSFDDRVKLSRIVRMSATQKEVLERLGVSLAGKNYARLETTCAIYKIPLPAKRATGPQRDKESIERQSAEQQRRWQVLADEATVRQAVSDAPSWTVAAQRLWGANNIKDREALKMRCRELFVVPEGRHKSGVLADREAVLTAVTGARSALEVLTRLNLSSSSHARLIAACEGYGIEVPRPDWSTRASIGHAKARETYRWGHPDDVLKRDPSVSQRRVRNMVLRYCLIPYICACCDSPPSWRGSPLTLTLDHVNGDPIDHRIENLRFVCPNCESQLPTHGARNSRTRAA